MNNILKHVKPSNIITICLKQEKDTRHLHVHDDGVGFDTSKKRNGIGLQNIFGRAFLVKGLASINSSPGKGCELIVNFDTSSPVIERQYYRGLNNKQTSI